MSEFPSIETLTAAKNAVERDRVIRETWEALVAAVAKYEASVIHERKMDNKVTSQPPDITGFKDYDGLLAAAVQAENAATEWQLEVSWRACAYVKARKGNE